RPFAMAIRPDGRRALVGFYQTGNFAVLDLDAQKTFQSPPVSTGAEAGFAAMPPDRFQGPIGMTPAIPLDRNLWPDRGVLHPFLSVVFNTNPALPSPDEARLFTWDVAYAQNGKFAAATHVGSGVPHVVTYAADPIRATLRLELGDLGFNATGTAVIDVNG